MQKTKPRGKTVGLRELNRTARKQQSRERQGGGDYWRPTRRADCVGSDAPCPFVACRHHLFLDARPGGGVKMPFGEDVAALDQMAYTCALRAAEKGGMTLEEVAALTNLTRERVRQIEADALRKLRRRNAALSD